MLKLLSWRLLIVALLLTGCTRMCGRSHADLTPEEVVEAYLDVSLNMTAVTERENLMQFTTGNLRSAIESVTDDVIRAAYIDRQYRIMEYSVIERRDLTPRETEITFRLKYKDIASKDVKEEDAPEVVTENKVSVIKEKGVWLVNDVLGNNETTILFPESAAARVAGSPGGTETPPEEEQTEQ